MAVKTVAKEPLLPPVNKRVKKRVKKLKRPVEAIDVEAIEITQDNSTESQQHDYTSILGAIAAGLLLGYGILALGKLGAFLAFTLGAIYLIKEVILK